MRYSPWPISAIIKVSYSFWAIRKCEVHHSSPISYNSPPPLPPPPIDHYIQTHEYCLLHLPDWLQPRLYCAELPLYASHNNMHTTWSDPVTLDVNNMHTTWSDPVTLDVPSDDCHRKLCPYKISITVLFGIHQHSSILKVTKMPSSTGLSQELLRMLGGATTARTSTNLVIRTGYWRLFYVGIMETKQLGNFHAKTMKQHDLSTGFEDKLPKLSQTSITQVAQSDKDYL